MPLPVLRSLDFVRFLFISSCLLLGCVAAFEPPDAQYVLRADVPVAEASFAIENRDPRTERFGVWLDVVGDVDGDGFEDILVSGSAIADRHITRSYLFRGPLERDLTTDDAAATFFSSWPEPLSPAIGPLQPIPPVGDVNGDGFADLAFGRMVESGESTEWTRSSVEIFFGPLTGDFSGASPDLVFAAETGYHMAGTPTLAVGDFFGDEALDVILLAQRSQSNLVDEGRYDGEYPYHRDVAWGWIGPLVPGTYTPDTADFVLQANGESGSRPPTTFVAGRCRPFANDTGDKDAFVIAMYDAWFDENGQRYSVPTITAYVWDEASPRLRRLDDHDGRVSHDTIRIGYAGMRIQPVCADLDGDGRDEIVYSAYELYDPADPEYPARGALGLVRLQRDVSHTTVDILVRGELKDQLGAWLVVVPDLTGDGLPEVAANTRPYDYDNYGASVPVRKEVRVFSGGSPVDLVMDGSIFSDRLRDGFAARFVAGDLTGDGVPDIIARTAGDRDKGTPDVLYIFSGEILRIPIE